MKRSFSSLLFSGNVIAYNLTSVLCILIFTMHIHFCDDSRYCYFVLKLLKQTFRLLQARIFSISLILTYEVWLVLTFRKMQYNNLIMEIEMQLSHPFHPYGKHLWSTAWLQTAVFPFPTWPRHVLNTQSLCPLFFFFF